jgi:O-antigen/teichoic acid export membrane protein
MALLPAFSKLENSSERKINAFFSHANKYTTLLVLPISLLLMVLSKEIVQTVYGAAFQSTPLFLTISCSTFLLVGIGHLTLSSFYNGLGQTKKTLKMSIITFVALAIASPALTLAFGAVGLVCAVVVSNALGTIYGAYTARKSYQVSFDLRSTLKIYGVAGLSSAPLILLLVFPSSPIFRIIVGGSSYLLLYFTMLPLTSILSPSEVRTAVGLMQKTPFLAKIGKVMLNYQQTILRLRAQ